jgi:hypothetical protein
MEERKERRKNKEKGTEVRKKGKMEERKERRKKE